MKFLKNVFIVAIILVLLLVLGVIGRGIYNNYFAESKNPIAKIEIENYGVIEIELYPEYAHNTVATFIKLAENGFYNGKVLYGKDDLCLYAGRNAEGEVVVPKANMIDPEVEAGSDEDIEFQIDGEFVVNGYEENVLSHEEGVLTMIRYDYTQQIPTLTTESYNSGNAQLGIMIDNGRSLNGLYAGFGKIINGMDIVKKIVADTQIVEVPEEEKTGIDEFSSKPVIKSVTVDTFGKNYGVPYYEEFFDFEEYLTDLVSQQYSTTAIE